MAIDERLPDSAFEYPGVDTQKKTTFGIGLLKGLRVTLRHLFSRSVTVHYPDERPILPPRSRGVIALKEENCTVCMLCARECPDWCIYIDGHKEERKPSQAGKRAKKYNVLDRFAIDYALCMYCGICVEVCPYDALFWTPEFEYAEHDVTNLTHEMEKLADWMYTVLPPPPLDDGAKGPEFKTVRPAAPAAGAAPQTPPSATAPASAAPADGSPQAPPRPSEQAPAAAAQSPSDLPPSESAEGPSPASEEPSETPTSGVSEEEAAEVRKKVLEEELAKGSDPRVAEGRAKAAELRARKGTKGPS